MYMETPHQFRIIAAERMHEGVIITFEDGTTALYPTSLLREMLSRAQQVTDERDET
jgi:hypothetical protein